MRISRNQLKNLLFKGKRITQTTLYYLIDSVPNFADDNYVPGFIFQSDWSIIIDYIQNDVVVYNDETYACILANTGIEPTDTLYWKKILGKTAPSSITVGTVISGTIPSVTNVGTDHDAIFDFVLAEGDKGDAAIITVNSVETLAPGESATAENVGTLYAAVLNFGIPAGSVIHRTVIIPDNSIGRDGDWAFSTSSTSNVYFKTAGVWSLVNSNKGIQGETGPAIVSGAFVGNDLVFTKDDASTVTITGAATLLKGVKGDTGDKTIIYSTVNIPSNSLGNNGDWAFSTAVGSNVYFKAAGVWSLVNSNRGAQGVQGDSGTITIGTVTTLAPGSSVTVTNVGTAENAILNIGIPAGHDGTDGKGVVSITLISTVGLVKTYRILFTDATIFDYTVTDGANGAGSGDVNGPASATAGNFASLDATGKNLSDSGKKAADFQPAGSYLVAADIAGKVNTTRTINTKALSADVVLGPDDLNDASSAHKFVSATDISNWNAKQAALGFTPVNTANISTDVVADAASTTKVPSVKTIKEYADGLVAGLLDYRGAYDASTNLYPATGGSGLAGVVMKGDMYIVSVAGVLNSKAIHIGDYIIALVDAPGQTNSNWDTLDTNLGYAPEDSANKSTTLSTDQASNTKYPTVKSVYDWAIGLFATISNLALKAPIANPSFTGTVALGTSPTMTTPAITGLPTGTGVASAATASTLAARDANGNLLANNLLSDYATTATAAGTTTLTVASKFQQFFTGTNIQTVVMPVATTLTNGQQWNVVNNSSGIVTINTSGGNTLVALPAGNSALITCINTAGGTGVASWNVSYYPNTPSAGGGTNGQRALTISTSAPSGGADGDVWYQYFAPVNIQTFLTTTGAGTWTVPSNWNNASNSIEVLGGGAGGNSGGGTKGPGGGAYSKVVNQTISGSIAYSVGVGGTVGSGGDTWFGNAAYGSAIVAAKGGTISAGGAAASGIGTTKYSGGNGESSYNNSAGGGAAGPNGNGNNGGGYASGGSADAGFGGAGGYAGAGSPGTEWDASHGCGGGGGGSNIGAGGPGGLYGGGGSSSQTAASKGGQGIIVITYSAVPPTITYIKVAGTWR